MPREGESELRRFHDEDPTLFQARVPHGGARCPTGNQKLLINQETEVRGGGLEPPRVFSPLAPQTSASANSAILAHRGDIAPNRGPPDLSSRSVAYCCPAGGDSGGASAGASAAGGGGAGSPAAVGAGGGAGCPTGAGKRCTRVELGFRLEPYVRISDVSMKAIAVPGVSV